MAMNRTNVKLKQDLNSTKDAVKQQKAVVEEKIEAIARLVSAEITAQFGICDTFLLFQFEQETSIKELKDANMKTIFDLQSSIKEKTAHIETLESELKETENLRHTIISLVQSKRKK